MVSGGTGRQRRTALQGVVRGRHPGAHDEPPSYVRSLRRPLPIRRVTHHDEDVNQTISHQEQQLLANLLRASGRDPQSFSAEVQPDGLVRVSGPRGTAFYPRESWFTRFSRHLDKSFFDPAVPPTQGPRLPRKSESNFTSAA